MQAWGNFFSMKPYSGKFSILFLPCLSPWGTDWCRLTSINSLAFNFLLGLANGRQRQVGEKMKVRLECIPLLPHYWPTVGWQCPSMKGHSSCAMTLSILLQAHLILPCFALLCFADTTFFTKWRCEATLQPASLSSPFFPTALLWWSVISDLWCYFCHCFEYTNYAHIRWWTRVTCLSL